MDGMLIIGTLVNVDNDTYLEEVVNRTLYLMKFMLTAWEKINKKRNLHVWPKGQDICWYG
jgi:hypothetical protein